MHTCLRCLRLSTKLNVWSRRQLQSHAIRIVTLRSTLLFNQSRDYSQDHSSKNRGQHASSETSWPREVGETKGGQQHTVPNAIEGPPAEKESQLLKPDVNISAEISQSPSNGDDAWAVEQPGLLTAKDIWEQWLLPARPYSFPDSALVGNMSGRYNKRIMRRVKFGLPSVIPNTRPCRPLLLTFDAYDTMFHPREPVAQQYCHVASTFGFDISVSDVEANFRKSFKELSKTHPNYGKAQGTKYRDWWRTLIRMTLQDLVPESEHDKLPRIANRLVQRFSNQEGYQLFSDLQALLGLIGTTWNSDIWAPRRTMLGVISNSDPRVREILSSYYIPIQPGLFPPRYATGPRPPGPATPSFATFSYNCGYSKPDPMIFDAATRDAQAALDSMRIVDKLTRTGTAWLNDIRRDFHHMHVGDELEKDVLPALDCGWDAIWLDRSAEEEISVRQIKGREVTVINNLTALTQIVSKERLEEPDGTPTQAPVWIDESREMNPQPLEEHDGESDWIDESSEIARRRDARPQPKIYDPLRRPKSLKKRNVHNYERQVKMKGGKVPGWRRGQYDAQRRDWFMRTAFAKVFRDEEEEQALRKEEDEKDDR